MKPDLAKRRAMIEKNNARIASWQEKNRLLREKLEEEENTAIVGIVREIGMTPEELADHFAELLQKKNPKKKKEVSANETDPA